MSAGERSLLAQWRDALRDSGVGSTAKLVGFTMGTYMNARGLCFPSKQTLAEGASLSFRAVDAAVNELEAAGFVIVVRTSGRRSNEYNANIPARPAGSESSEPRTNGRGTPHLLLVNPAPGAHESTFESERESEYARKISTEINDSLSSQEQAR